MQRQYIIATSQAPEKGDRIDGFVVIDVSHEFPAEGCSYDDLRRGECPGYVRVTEEEEES